MATSPTQLSKPTPRPPRTPARAAQIRRQNRRREYLERHPSYFDSPDHELADPVLYDVLIRRFQSGAERQADGLRRGFSRVLEADLFRGEARLAELTAGAPVGPDGGDGSGTGRNVTVGQSHSHVAVAVSQSTGRIDGSNLVDGDDDDSADRRAQKRQEALEADRTFSGELGAEPPETKEEGRQRWINFLRDRFIHGRDEDFDYAIVDQDDGLDVLERRDEEDDWFDGEEPEWADDADTNGRPEKETSRERRERRGETGIQDF